MLNSFENLLSLPPRLNKTNQSKGVIKITPGQNPNNVTEILRISSKDIIQSRFGSVVYSKKSAVTLKTLKIKINWTKKISF